MCIKFSGMQKGDVNMGRVGWSVGTCGTVVAEMTILLFSFASVVVRRNNNNGNREIERADRRHSFPVRVDVITMLAGTSTPNGLFWLRSSVSVSVAFVFSPRFHFYCNLPGRFGRTT